MVDCERKADIPSVVIDDAAGTMQIIDHLIDLGHTHFCEISGPLDWFSAQERHHTCQDTFAARGLESPLHTEANWTTSGGYQAMKRILEQDRSFTAVICANDSMALGAMRALHQAGIGVPYDMAIVGYDDIPEAPYFVPALTTVRQNFIQLSLAGFEYLIELMDNPDTPLEQRWFTPELVIRESTNSA